jgi:hypothetical protein
MTMTIEQARAVRDGLGLKEGATAEEWVYSLVYEPWCSCRNASDVIEAYAVFHAAPIAEERDRLRVEVAELREAVRRGADNTWRWWGACPYCSFGEPNARLHDADCPTVALLGMRRSTEGREVTCPTAEPPSIPAQETCDPPELIGDTLRRCGYFGKGGTT